MNKINIGHNGQLDLRTYTRAAQQFLKWGVQVRERSERKKFF